MFIFSTNQFRRTLLAVVLTGGAAVGDAAPTGLQQLRYGNPGLAVDLAVGLWAWPMPMDYDGDGDLDLLVSCPDRPSNGIYFFENPGGGGTGKLLPTGRPTDELQTQGARFEVSMVDAGNPCVFVRAQDLGLAGSELPDTLSQFSEVLDTLEAIRLGASVAMGIAQNIDQASAIPGIPKIALISSPADSVTLSAETIRKHDCDLVLRMISVGQPHRAMPVTGALCTAVAGRIEGTLVNQLTNTRPITQSIRIAHPSGVSEVDAEVVRQGDGWHSRSASINRTARRLMDGYVYVSTANLDTGNFDSIGC